MAGCKIGKMNPAYRHGHNMRGKRTTEYEIWAGLRARCNNPSHKLYADYGGRGISVCGRWQEDFQNFLDDMGKRPDKLHSIERRDNAGNYTPENCQWATRTDQARNRRNNIILVMSGESKCLKEWCDDLDLVYKNVHRRIKYYGWSLDAAMEREGFSYGKAL